MSNDLYFIPIIARALQEGQPAETLRDAFDEIIRLGRIAEYAGGYANFERFMREVARHRVAGEMAAAEAEAMHELMAELGTDAFEGTETERQAAIESIQSIPRWRDEFAELCTLMEKQAKRRPRIRVLREDTVLAEIDLGQTTGSWTIRGVLPGHYSVVLDTGRVIWEGRLTERDLLWAEAFPGEPLELAADTGETVPKATRKERLLDGELILQVIAGLESGRMELEFHATGDS